MASHILVWGDKMRAMRLFLLILAASILVGGTAVGGAFAQPADLDKAGQNSADPDLQAQIDAAFKQVLAHPADVDIAYKYAALLIKAGSYEPAAGVLERILVVDSKQPVIRLELGVIYFRLGSYALAQTYIEAALSDPGLTPAERASGLQYLAAVRTQLAVNRIAGSISTGVRYQTDANLGSSNNLFEIGTSTFIQRTADQSPKREWNPFVLGRVEDTYDLQTENEAAIVSSLSFYGARQIGDKELSTMAAEATVGPSLKPLRVTLPDLHVRVYGIFGAAYLDDQFFSDVGGAGVSAVYKFNDRFAVDGAYEYRYEHYHNVGNFLFANLLKGDYNLLRLRGAYQITPTQSLSVETVFHRDITVDAAALTNDAVEINALYRLQYGSPLPEALPAPWSVSLLIGGKLAGFRAPDPAVNPLLTRNDNLFSVGATNREPLIGSWEAYQQVQYDRNGSNVPQDQYNNYTFIAGVTWSF
jgi:tetratricopeptide (TPR) repeat protein